jgi:hypothetical protein
MKSRPIFSIVLLASIVSLSCGLTSKLTNIAGPTGSSQSSSPFAAEATSAMSVQLSWKPVSGAQKYLIAVGLGNSDFMPVADLAADQTSYEDFPVPDSTELTYRLQTVTSSATSDVGTAKVTTPAVKPDPLTVQVNDYKPIAWTPPTLDPQHPITDPSLMYPPGFDPNNPDAFDPSTLNQQVAASAPIGPNGGEVTVSTPDKITYTLTVPAGALDDVTTITLTPIESIDSLPFSGGLQGAVRIAPDGLILDVPATLTIARADGAPVPSGMLNLPFTFEQGGQEFSLYPFAPPPDTTTSRPGAAHLASLAAGPLRAGTLGGLSIADLQSYGVGKGTQKEARSVVQNHPPRASVTQVLNEVAYTDDLAPLETSAMWQQQELDKANAAVSMSDVLTVLEGLEVRRAHSKDKAVYDKALDVLLDRIYRLLLNNKNKCLTKDDYLDQAIASRLSHAKSGTFSATLAQRFKSKYGDGVLKDLANMTKVCILNLHIQSQITADTPPAQFIIPVEGDISNLKFGFSRGGTILSGKGTLVYGPIQVIPHQKGTWSCEPWEPANGMAVNLNITRLQPIFFDVENGQLQDFNLAKMSAVDDGVFRSSATCIDASQKPAQKTTLPISLGFGSGSLWFGYFNAAHMPQVEIQEWTVYTESFPPDRSNHPIYGQKVISRPSFAPMGGYGTWSEESSFTLTNTSGK